MLKQRPWPPATTSTPAQATDSVVHLLAPNATSWTYEGTNTWIIGHPGGEACLVIDPGTDDPRHLDAIIDTAVSRSWQIDRVVLTHDHNDHSDGARTLADRVGARIAGVSTRFSDDILADGDLLKLDGVSVEVMHTPGHSADSIALYLEDDGSVLTGDTILGDRSSGIFGRLSEFLSSLERLRALAVARPLVLLPGHGPIVTDPQHVIDRVLRVRLNRVDQIAAEIAAGQSDLNSLVNAIYPALDPTRHLSAAITVASGLHYLAEPGRHRAEIESDSLTRLIVQSDAYLRRFLP